MLVSPFFGTVTFVFVIATARKHCEIVKIPNQLAVCRPKKRRTPVAASIHTRSETKRPKFTC